MAKNNRNHFLVVFITASVGLLLTLSLMPTGSHPNLLGNLGSGLFYFLYSGFGLCAWVFPFVFFFVAYSAFKDKPIHKSGFKLVGLSLVVLSISVLFRVIIPNNEMREGVKWSGLLGSLIGDPMEAVLTPFGTAVICFLVIVLALWFLEAEDHVVKGIQGAGEGFARGGGWFKEHGFNTFAVLYEEAQKLIQTWISRQDEKRVVEEAHRKLEGDFKVGNTPVKTAKTPAAPLVPMVEPKPQKTAKTSGRTLFTGEAEPPQPEPVVSEPASDEDDVVAAAMAEATLKTEKSVIKEKGVYVMEDESAMKSPKRPSGLSAVGNCRTFTF